MHPLTPKFLSLRKDDLQSWCDRLLTGDPVAVESCVSFIEAETLGVWHNRARAMMSRRLKHCELNPAQRLRVVKAILGRLEAGRFSEQFRDQLRLVLLLDPRAAWQVAQRCQSSSVPHVQRFATWVLAHSL